MGLKNFGHVPSDMVERIRSKFLEIFETSPEDFYHQDADKVVGDDWYIKRFVIAAYKNETEALEKLVETLKWRKEVKLRETPDNYFPVELFESGVIFPYESDFNGTATLWIRCGAVKKFGEYTEVGKRFMIHELFKVDEANGPEGFALVIDYTGTGGSSIANIDLLHYFITTLHHRFPAGVNYCLNYQIPWILKTMWSAVKYWIPEKRRDIIRYVDKSDLLQFFDRTSVPLYLGGDGTREWKRHPENCPDLLDFGRYELGLTEDTVQKLNDEWEHFRDTKISWLDQGPH